jgi:PAS domain S-box-containing protein
MTSQIPKIRLRTTLVIPLVLQIISVVGLVGWLSFRNGQNAINKLATQLQSEAAFRVHQYLNNYLETPHQINLLNLKTFNSGLINWDDVVGMEKFFRKELQIFDVSYINYGNQQGNFIGVYFDDKERIIISEEIKSTKPDQVYTYKTNVQGQRIGLKKPPEEYQFRQEPWYTEAVKVGKPVWSKIYDWGGSDEDVLGISASYPVYNPDKTLKGVLGVDLTLARISDFLRQLKISPSSRIFIIERDGLLVANSSEDKPFIVVNDSAQRLNAMNSSDPLIQATANFLKKDLGDFYKIENSRQLKFNYNGDRIFIHLEPWRDQLGLNWLAVVVVPEADFMGEINANTRNTLLSMLAALLVAILIGILMAQQLTKPILKASQASEKIADGDLKQRIKSSAIVEINTLANSFNRMGEQLQTSFQDLEEKEKRFRTLTANIPGVTYRCLYDEDWTMEYISDVIEDLSGYSAADFIDNRVRTFTSIIYPEDRQRIAVEIDKALALNQPYMLEYRLLHRDGTIHWIDERGRASFDEQGRIRHLDGAIFDITAQKLAKDALRIAEEKYRSIFENALEGIFQASPDGYLISVNPAMSRIFGYDSPENTIAQLTDIKEQLFLDNSTRDDFFQDIEIRGQVSNFECRASQKNQQIIWIEIDARQVCDASGQVLYYEGIVQDINERKQREESLQRQLEELKIEIDQQKRQKEVSLITESGYFQQIQSEIADLDLDEFWNNQT